MKPLLWPFLKSPKSGAQTTLYVALAPELQMVSGKYFSDCTEIEPAEQAGNDQISEWLWKMSLKWTGLE